MGYLTTTEKSGLRFILMLGDVRVSVSDAVIYYDRTRGSFIVLRMCPETKLPIEAIIMSERFDEAWWHFEKHIRMNTSRSNTDAMEYRAIALEGRLDSGAKKARDDSVRTHRVSHPA